MTNAEAVKKIDIIRSWLNDSELKEALDMAKAELGKGTDVPSMDERIKAMNKELLEKCREVQTKISSEYDPYTEIVITADEILIKTIIEGIPKEAADQKPTA